jgi:hypothetical protein
MRYQFIQGQVHYVTIKTDGLDEFHRGAGKVSRKPYAYTWSVQEHIMALGTDGNATIHYPVGSSGPGQQVAHNVTVTPYGRTIPESFPMFPPPLNAITFVGHGNPCYWGLPLPERPVQVGEQWTVEYVKPPKMDARGRPTSLSSTIRTICTLMGLEDFNGTPTYHIRAITTSAWTFSIPAPNAKLPKPRPSTATETLTSNYWLSRNTLAILHMNVYETGKGVEPDRVTRPSGQMEDWVTIETRKQEIDFTDTPPPPKTKPTTVKPPK